MSRPGQLLRHALVRTALALSLLIGGLAALSVMVPQSLQPTTAHAQSTSDDVLLIHGFQGPGVAADSPGTGTCHNTWHSLQSVLQTTLNWSGQLKAVGYYGQEGSSPMGCEVNLALACKSRTGGCVDQNNNPVANQHQTACDNYFWTAANDGTNNNDLRNLGCQLAWYMWNTYTSQHKTVRVVTHSMGGLIIRWALDRVSKQDPAFPPFLYIPQVVQIAAPNGGIPANVGQAFACNGCTQGNNMGSGSDMMNILTGEDYAPVGSQSVTSAWTIMSSWCDHWFYNLGGGGVDHTSAMAFPAGQFTQVHKILYEDNVTNSDGSYVNSCTDGPNNTTVHSYQHGDYLYDTQFPGGTNNQYPIVASCDNCVGEPTNTATPLGHSLDIVYRHLSADSPGAPPMNCYSQPNEANCNGLTYIEQNCPDHPQAQTATDANVSVVLHYSGSACQSNWTTAQITSTGASQHYHITKVDVERQATSRLGATQIVDYPSASANIQTWYSRMVWAPNSPALGCVWYTNGTNSSSICTPPSPTASNCVSQPNTSNCDGQDYTQQGCNHYPQSQQYNDNNISVILEYSTNCQSNFTWAQTASTSYVIRQIDIERQSVPQTPAKTLTDYPGTTTWYTNMLWAPNAAARGCVWYGPVNSHNTIYGPFCTPWSPVVTNCAASPSDANCNGQDYIQQGCNHYVQGGAYSNSIITVDLEWSTNCQSNFTWVQMNNTTQFQLYKVDIERQSGTNLPNSLEEYPTGNTWYTNMLWAPYYSARGCAWYVSVDMPKIYGPYCTAWV